MSLQSQVMANYVDVKDLGDEYKSLDNIVFDDLGQPGRFTYIIKPGDTLSEIATQFGITTKSIITANQLKSRSLSVGSSLVISQAE